MYNYDTTYVSDVYDERCRNCENVTGHIDHWFQKYQLVSSNLKNWPLYTFVGVIFSLLAGIIIGMVINAS